MKLFCASLLLLGSQEDDWTRFQKLVKDKDFIERCNAIDLIKNYKDKRMVQALLPLLADPHARVVYRTVQALSATTDPEGIALLEDAVHSHSNADVRRGVAEALGRLRRESSVSSLLKALKGSRPDAAGESAWALGEIGSPEAVGDLRAALETRAWQVRAFALEALGKIAPAEAEEPCRKLAEDRDYQVRMVVLETAAKVSPEFGMETFRALYADKDWRVRVTAIEASTLFRHRDAVPLLVERLGEEDGRLRWDLLLALKDLTGQDLGLNAKNWKGWWEANRETFQPVAREKGKKEERPQEE